MHKIDDVALKVKGGLISPQQGAKELLSLIFQNKAFFGLQALGEDDFMDFLEFQYKGLERILALYNQNLGNFSNFLYTNVQCNYSTWKRGLNQKNLREKTLMLTQEDCCFEAELKFHSNETALVYEKSEELKNKERELKLIQKELLGKKYETLTGSGNPGKSSQKYVRLYNLRRRAILVLTLKSCFFITEEHIRKASILTNIPYENLEYLCRQAMDSMSKRMARREKVISCRNNAFFYHKRYELELSRYHKNSHWYDSIKTRDDKKTDIWKAKNKLLNERRFLPTPSNRAIARLTGMNERQISYILQQAEHNVDNISLKDYYSSYENLFSNRKSEQEKRDGRDSQ